MDFSFWDAQWKKEFDGREARIRANPQIDYWDKRAYDFSEMRKSNDYDFGRNVCATFTHALPKGATVLDIGAGPGSFVIPFAQRGYRVTGLEPSGEMRRILAENAKEANVSEYSLMEDYFQEIPKERLAGNYHLVIVSLVLWMFRDVWEQIERMEAFANPYCAIVAGIPDASFSRRKSIADVREFQVLYNMLLSRGRFPQVRTIRYRCDRSVEAEIASRKIQAEQYELSWDAEREQAMVKELKAQATNGKCLVSTRAAVIWWNKEDTVSMES